MAKYHSSEICLLKYSSEMLQNLPYFWNFFTHEKQCFTRGLNFFLNEKPQKNHVGFCIPKI